MQMDESSAVKVVAFCINLKSVKKLIVCKLNGQLAKN